MSAPAEHTEISPPLLELAAVDIAAPHAPAAVLVRGVDWRLSAGEYWAVGGLEGVGKSGWLTTAAGLQRPAAGLHRLFGEDSAQLSADELVVARRRIGMVFEQGGRLFPQMTVAENVALPVRYHQNCLLETASGVVMEVLALAGLESLATQPAGQLSRAWQLRVALARALVLRPEVLLLDNPLAGLDPRQTRWWLDMLVALNAGHPWLAGRPLTIAATTDDLRPWRDRARQFALLQGSRWQVLGGREHLSDCQASGAQELLAA